MNPRALISALCGPERDSWICPGLCRRLIEAQTAQTVKVDVIFAYGIRPVMTARNWSCENALYQGADWLVMCDADQVPPERFVERVLAEIHRRDEISIAVLPTWIWAPMGATLNIRAIGQKNANEIWVSSDRIPPAGWHEIQAGGAGVIFIRHEVLAKMERPWFRFGADALAAIQRGEDSGPGEDFDFVIRAREQYGFRTFADSNYLCDHLHTQSMSAVYRNKQAAVEAVQKGKIIAVQQGPYLGLGAEPQQKALL